MFAIHIRATNDGVMLAPRGDLDGSAAWRLVRLATRLSRSRVVAIDLGPVERVCSFAASVLATGLRGLRVAVVSMRPEHFRVLRAAGLADEERRGQSASDSGRAVDDLTA